MYNSYETPSKRHFIWMMWFVLAAGFVIIGVYLIGHASYDNNKAEHQRNIECLQAGGEMEKLPGISGIYCNKDD